MHVSMMRVMASIVTACVVLAGCKGEDVANRKGSESHVVQRQTAGGKILLVHSYHREYEWVAGISNGVRRAIEGANVDLQMYYMDTKRRTDEAWKRESGQAALETVDAWDPDVVIAVDDNAQQFFARQLAGKTRPNIVFCGVNGDAADYGYPAENVTGILERPHFKDTLALLKRFVPDAERIAVITDHSPTSDGTLKYLKPQEIAFEVAAWDQPRDFDDWKECILAYQSQADAIVVYMYHTLKRDGKAASMTPADVMAWTVANSRIPVAGMFSFAVDDGALCGVVESAVEHGREAGFIARRLLEGTPMTQIPIVTATQGQTMLNLETARRLGIKIPEELVRSVDIVIGGMHAH